MSTRIKPGPRPIGDESMIRVLVMMPPKMRSCIRAKSKRDGTSQSELIRRALLAVGVYGWEKAEVIKV